MSQTIEISALPITYEGLEYYNTALAIGSKATYALAHDADEAEYLTQAAEYGTVLVCWSSFYLGFGYWVARGYMSFDTSPLGAAARIISATLAFSIGAVKEEDTGHATLHIVQGVHTETLTLADFGKLKAKTVSGGSIDYPYVDSQITLNAIGRSWIRKTGMTRLGLRLAGDINNTTPTGDNYIWAYSPILTIKYIPVAGNPNIDQLIYQHAERMKR